MHTSKTIKKAFIAALISLFIICAGMFTLSACGEKKLDKIEVTIPPVKVEYVAGENFDPSGMVVTAYYSDNTQAVVTDYTLRPEVTTTLDTTYTKVTVFYLEGGITKSADIAITVKEAAEPEPLAKTILSAIPIVQPKLTYNAGETFSAEGMQWTIVYSDASTDSVTFTEETEYTVDIERPLAVGDAAVNVTYGGYTMQLIIVVGPKKAVETTIKTMPKTVYNEGEYFVADGMVWEIVYSDNSRETVTFNSEIEYTVIGGDWALERSDTSVSVTYAGITKEIGITVKKAPSPWAEIENHEIIEYCKTEYFVGQQFDINGLKVEFAYDDGGSQIITFTDETDVSYSPNTLGSNNSRVIVSYKGYSFYVPVNVRIPDVESVTIKTMPDKTKYIAGEKFDPAGLTVTILWEDGYEQDLPVTSPIFIVPDTPLVEGTTAVNVILRRDDFGNVPFNVPVTVVGIDSVTIKTLPDKTRYVAGESFDPKGMAVTVSYSDDTSKDIEITRNSDVLFPGEAIKATDTEVEIFYAYSVYGQNFPLVIDIEIIKGVYIEAENAATDSTTYEINDNAEDKNGVNNASGGKYVADMKAGDSVTFSFSSDAAGNGDIAFVLASQYLKQDNGWTPIEMGDCQFNRICEFWLNGEKQEIDDSVILPGGEADDTVNGENWLWYNWKEVVFDNVQLVKGRNDVVLKFIEHDYGDCSQTSFNNKFTANVDSLKVTSAECEVSPCDFSLSVNALTAGLLNDNGVVYYVIEAQANYVDLRQDEVKESINFQLRLNKNLFGGNWNEYLDNAEDHIISFTDDTHFTFKVALNSLDAGGYLTRFGLKLNEDIDDLILGESAVDEEKIFVDGYYYYLIANPENSGYYGCVALVKESAKHVENYTAESIDIEEQDGKIMLVITGSVSYSEYAADEAAEALKNLVKVTVYNTSARYGLEISSAAVENAALSGTDEYGVKKYSAEYTVNAVLSYVKTAGVYYVSYKNTDKIVFESVAETNVTLGSFTYAISADTDESPVITVETAEDAYFSIGEVTDVNIALENGKPVYILEGYYSAGVYSDSEIEALIAQTYFDLQRNPDAAGDGSNSWTAMHPEVIGVTLSYSMFEMRYDLSTLPEYCYTSHFGQEYNNKGELAGKDVKLDEYREYVITVGVLNYTLVSVPYAYDGARFWGCVGIKIENVFKQIEYVSLEEYDGKPYLALCGYYNEANISDEQALAYLEQACANLYADFTNNPNNEFGSTDGSWTTTVLSIEDGTIKLFAGNGYFRILLDLSSAKEGQALFSHLSFDGKTNVNFKCGYGNYYDTITVGGLTYSFIDTYDFVDYGDWQYGLAMVRVE